MEFKNVYVISTPVVNENLCILRSKYTDTMGVKCATRQITNVLLYEASKNLPQVDTEVETPLKKFVTKSIDKSLRVIISPILRAGLVFTDSSSDMLPRAEIRHIGMYRDEETLKPVWYYNKLPKRFEYPEKTYVYLTDPMLATGNSLLETIRMYEEKGLDVSHIRCVCLIAAPEGIQNIKNYYPDIEIFVAAIDEGLNENGYILPGLGDAGDRIFNTIKGE
jgi:uracil phosphoribosyltransferase